MNREPQSLFDPAGVSGSLVTILCALAVATLGLLMLSGHWSVRRAARVVIGCFVLFGAQALAQELLSLSAQATGTGTSQAIVAVQPTRDPPTPIEYDPYARASMPSR
jgi:hypothetical protein